MKMNFFVGNSTVHMKRRLLLSFSITSLVSAFVIFFSFAIFLVIDENNKLEEYLVSFKPIAERLHRFDDGKPAKLSPYVTAYYSHESLPARYKEVASFELEQVYIYKPYKKTGFFLFHSEFLDHKGMVKSVYLVIGARDGDFGDDNWGTILLLALCFAAFLNCVFWFTLKKTFSNLMTPVGTLNEQLKNADEAEFYVEEQSVEELKQLTTRLNQYKEMKEKLVKQEMMFAKYTSHELRTPIAVISGAANLQKMSAEPTFQNKQRDRILLAANSMQETVEVLLSLVKQDNDHEDAQRERVTEADEFHTLVSFFDSKLKTKNLELMVNIEALPTVNLPPVVLSMLLKNLLSNAIRSATEGLITLDVTHRSIAVIDTGQGLLQGGTTYSKPTDHGLGLLIVEHLCQRYGWQFELMSNQNSEGCTARLYRTQAVVVD